MFHRCIDAEEGKKLFRRLAFFLHPDRGGENDLMILLQEAYDIFHGIIGLEKNFEKTKWHESKNLYQETFEHVYEGDEALNILDEVHEYAETHPKFKTDFVESLQEYLKENGFLTSSQYNSVVRIYYSFRMDSDKEKKSWKS